MTLTRCFTVAALTALLSLSLAGDATSQAYKYTDDHGRVHFTEDPGQVPERYRNQIETREMPVHEYAGGEARTAAADSSFSFFEGSSMTPEQEEQASALLNGWMVPFMITLVGASLLALVMVVHPFLNGEPLWGVLNFFIGLTVPFYIGLKMEASMGLRASLILLYLSPIAIMVWVGVRVATIVA